MLIVTALYHSLYMVSKMAIRAFETLQLCAAELTVIAVVDWWSALLPLHFTRWRIWSSASRSLVQGLCVFSPTFTFPFCDYRQKFPAVLRTFFHYTRRRLFWCPPNVRKLQHLYQGLVNIFIMRFTLLNLMVIALIWVVTVFPLPAGTQLRTCHTKGFKVDL
jgi:hypothetical protein